MLDRRVCITGVGSHVPENSVSNEEALRHVQRLGRRRWSEDHGTFQP